MHNFHKSFMAACKKFSARPIMRLKLGTNLTESGHNPLRQVTQPNYFRKWKRVNHKLSYLDGQQH